MAIATSTITTQEITNQTGPQTYGPYSAGTFSEIIFDYILTAYSGDEGFIIINRINPLGTVVQLYSAGLIADGPNQTGIIDIGPTDGYMVSHAFGDQINVQMEVGADVTYSGSFCIQGKGW